MYIFLLIKRQLIELKKDIDIWFEDKAKIVNDLAEKYSPLGNPCSTEVKHLDSGSMIWIPLTS